jgi:hypothetical protein
MTNQRILTAYPNYDREFKTIDENGEIYENKQSFFGGTLVNITLLCDESLYALDFEADDELLF